MGVDSGLMKRLNRKLIRGVMQSCKEATKPEMAGRTGLSVVTVNSLLAEFLESGEVVEAGLAPSGGGRPGKCYRYRSDYRTAVLLYGHQQNDRNLIHVRVIDLAGMCLWKKEAYYDEITPDCFNAALDEAIGRFPQTGLIGFGLPGEEVSGAITICDYRRLLGTEFMRHSRERYQIPILFENDINAMTYGACGEKALEKQSVAGIYFPRIYPPGSGLVLNGRIHYGAGHFAGELGKLPVPVPWNELDYYDEEELFSVLKAIIGIFCCTTAPDRLVLYGDFFSETIGEKLREYGEELLEGRYRVTVELRENVEKDYEAGMIRRALEELAELME